MFFTQKCFKSLGLAEKMTSKMQPNRGFQLFFILKPRILRDFLLQKYVIFEYGAFKTRGFYVVMRFGGVKNCKNEPQEAPGGPRTPQEAQKMSPRRPQNELQEPPGGSK